MLSLKGNLIQAVNENEIGFFTFKEQNFENMQIESQEEYLRQATY